LPQRTTEGGLSLSKTAALANVRSGISAARGILQVDGYAAYNKVVESDRGNDGITLAGCWSHSSKH